MAYYIYENWRAKGHRTMIHLSDCHFCNNGKGLAGETRPDNGKWHGPYKDLESAESFARTTGVRLEYCGN
ncbi:MAG TPA: hypothetical protein VJM08_05935 [Anaerolineales bacterium]|nr:hypothetical protein [Anaerolineales bacterium]